MATVVQCYTDREPDRENAVMFDEIGERLQQDEASALRILWSIVLIGPFEIVRSEQWWLLFLSPSEFRASVRSCKPHPILEVSQGFTSGA